MKSLCLMLLSLFSHSVVSDFLWPHGQQHTRFSCPSPSPGVCLNSCPLHQWCHPTISSSVDPFSSCIWSFPASASFLMSWLFVSDGHGIGASVSVCVLPVNIQGWFPLGLTGHISLQPKNLLHYSSKASVLQRSAFFMVQLLPPYMTTGKTIALTMTLCLMHSVFSFSWIDSILTSVKTFYN